MSTATFRVILGGQGTVTPHPDDKSELAEQIRATLNNTQSPDAPDKPLDKSED